MGSAHLADFVDNAEYQLGLLVPACERRELDARTIQTLCDTFRQRGVCLFLLSGDPGPFFACAEQSAGAYAFYLDGADASQRVTSRAKPVYDAIGSGHFDVATAIATRSRATWNPPKEYEDDFLFVWFLLQHGLLGASAEQARQLLREHERASDGGDTSRRGVATAMLDKDPSAFDRHLRALLDERAERVEALVAREAMPEEHWSWLRYFSSEGLALLALADRAGLATGTDYLHVPERLRRPQRRAFDPDAWRVGRP